MYRRALLVSIGGLASGCVGAPSTARSSPPANAGTVEYRITDVSVTTTTESPPTRYVLEPVAFYSADAVDRERADSDEPVVVMAVEEITDAGVRRAVETAIRDGQWRSDEVPDDLAELVERVDFFTGASSGRTYTHVGLELYESDPDRAPPITFDATVSDGWVAADDPGALEFTLTNGGDVTQSVFSGTVPPFSIVRANRVDGGGSFLLWRDYEGEGCVSISDQGIAVCDIGVLTEMEAGETLSREYAVLPSSTEHYPEYTVPPGPGTYRSRGDVRYSRDDGAPGSTLSYEVSFDLELLEPV